MELEDTIMAELASLGHGPERFVEGARETIVPETRPSPPRVPSTPPDAPLPQSERVELGAIIGSGGMGVVYGGQQKSLGRPVAVKTVRVDRRGPRARAELLREALITGAIEHPNIVPVHDLEETEDGQVLVVLKQVDGVSWYELIHDADKARELLGVEDMLEWNLDVLAQLANAVRFAHERGFLHRDLKPANVLIGAFGEVYLADWGIAVAMRDDGTGRFPLAKDATSLAGTPAYMPPEMLGGRADELGPATDLYLLGAILFEIITGEPPHLAGTLAEILRSVVRSEPDLPADVSPELETLVRTAMRAEPKDRYRDAAELTRALARYRSHRHSVRLSAAADASAEALLDALSGEDAEDDPYPLFAESRFAYRQALQTWPENAAAKRGLARVLHAMIESELARDQPSAAARLLREHPEPEAELVSAVEEAQASAAARRDDLERLEAEFDPLAGMGPRTLLLAMIGILFALTPLASKLMIDRGWVEDDYTLGVMSTIGLFFATAAAVAFSYQRLRFSMVTWRIVFSIFAALSAMLGMLLADAALGSEPRLTLVRLMLVFAVVMTFFAIQYTPRLLISAGGYLVCHAIGAFRPEWRFELLAVSNVVLALNLLYVRRWARLTFGR